MMTELLQLTLIFFQEKPPQQYTQHRQRKYQLPSREQNRKNKQKLTDLCSLFLTLVSSSVVKPRLEERGDKYL